MITESQWEDAMLEWLSELAWEPGTGSQFEDQRPSLSDLVHHDEFLIALRKLNPGVPDQYLLQAHADILQPRSQDALTENKAFHDRLVDGFRGLTYTDQTGREETRHCC